MIRSQRLPRLRTEDDDFRVFLDYLSGIDSVDFLAEVHNIPTSSVEMILDVYLDEALDDSPEPRFNPLGAAPPKFSDEQKDEIASKYSQDESSTFETLALEYNCSPSTIRKILIEKNISMRTRTYVKKKKLTPTQELELIRRYQEEIDIPPETLCSDFSISKYFLYQLLKEHGIEARIGPPRKLTEDQELDLIRRYKEHHKVETLCSDFSITFPTLYEIFKRRRIELRGHDKKLTEDQILELIRRYQTETNITPDALSIDFSMNVATVYRLLKERGIELRGRGTKLTDAQELELIRRYQNEPVATLCSEFSISSITLYKILKRCGIELRGRGPDKKLTEAQEHELVRRYQTKTYTDIDSLCTEFSISRTTLFNILKRRGFTPSRM